MSSRPGGARVRRCRAPRHRELDLERVQSLCVEVVRRHLEARGRLARLGREPLDRPAVRGARVAMAVMQPVVAVLPELPGVGLDAEAAPVVAHGQLALRVLAVELLDAALEPVAVRDDLALR